MALATALVQDEMAGGTPPHDIVLCGLGQGAGVAIAAALNRPTPRPAAPPPPPRLTRLRSSRGRGRAARRDGRRARSYAWDTAEGAGGGREGAGEWGRYLAAAGADAWAVAEAEAEAEALPPVRRREMRRVGGVLVLSGWLPASLKALHPPWAEGLSVRCPLPRAPRARGRRAEARGRRAQPSYWKGEPVGLRGGVPMLVCHGRNDTVRTLLLPCGQRAARAGADGPPLPPRARGRGAERPPRQVVPRALGRRCRARAARLGFAAEHREFDIPGGHGIAFREMAAAALWLNVLLPPALVPSEQRFGREAVRRPALRAPRPARPDPLPRPAGAHARAPTLLHTPQRRGARGR